MHETIASRECVRRSHCAARRTPTHNRTHSQFHYVKKYKKYSTCLAVKPTQFTPPHQTRQNSPVCVCLAWRCEFASTCIELRTAFSPLTLLVERQEGHPACRKTEWWCVGVVICLERGADLHMAQRMPLPLTISCFSKIQGPNLQNIVRQSYDNLTIMPKLRSTYDGRLIYKTSYEGRKAFLRYDSLAKL